MPRSGVVSFRPEFIHSFTRTLTIPHSSPTNTDLKPCAPGASPLPQPSPTPTNVASGGTLCHSTMTTTRKPVIHPDPLHSPTAAASAISSSPNTRFGTARPDGIVTIVEDATISAKIATTPTPFVLQNRSALFPSPIATHCLGWRVGVLRHTSIPATTRMTGGTTARILPTTTTIGKLDVWTHYAREGVMS